MNVCTRIYIYVRKYMQECTYVDDYVTSLVRRYVLCICTSNCVGTAVRKYVYMNIQVNVHACTCVVANTSICI